VLALAGNLSVEFASHTTARSPSATGESLGAVDLDDTVIVVIASGMGLFRLRMACQKQRVGSAEAVFDYRIE